jgi:hypothetical protein
VRRHTGTASRSRWAGVSRSALRLLLQLTAGASQPFRWPHVPCRCYAPCVLRRTCPRHSNDGLDVQALNLIRLAPGYIARVMFPEFGVLSRTLLPCYGRAGYGFSRWR